jgi:hypothetical protein
MGKPKLGRRTPAAVDANGEGGGTSNHLVQLVVGPARLGATGKGSGFFDGAERREAGAKEIISPSRPPLAQFHGGLGGQRMWCRGLIDPKRMRILLISASV